MTVEEDFEAWNQYPEHRWLFNKLEVALRMGYHAGPSGVPISKPGEYIVRGVSSPKYLNIETKGTHIFEIHLRSGNDHFWEYPIGTVMYPVWNTDSNDYRSDLPFVGNLHSDSFLYSASGHLQSTRLGYRVKIPSKV